jgi:hypothetical protein
MHRTRFPPFLDRHARRIDRDQLLPIGRLRAWGGAPVHAARARSAMALASTSPVKASWPLSAVSMRCASASHCCGGAGSRLPSEQMVF